jgi:hypothetical protein
VFYSAGVGQLSFYSAEACAPAVADLAGLLCGPGQVVGFGRGSAARISVALVDRWRAELLLAACSGRGVVAELTRTPDGRPLLGTAFRADLAELAGGWLAAAGKCVPAGLAPAGGLLRVWAICAGRAGPAGAPGYLLGLDPHAAATHEPLRAALARAGVPTTLLGEIAGGPALRVTGARRLGRLLELVGDRPGAVPAADWPVFPTRRVTTFGRS